MLSSVTVLQRYAIFVCIFVCVAVYSFYSYGSTELRIPQSSEVSKVDNKTRVSKVDNRTRVIRLWNAFWGDDTYEFGIGTEPFRKFNCEVQNCLLTYKDTLKSIDKYDAVVFHGPEFNPKTPTDYPLGRSSHQRFVFFSMESPNTRPLQTDLNGFFNWTMTYRLDSEILVIYFAFYDLKTGEMMSPTTAPRWLDKKVDDKSLQQYMPLLEKKQKSVAWFVSNCQSSNDRRERVNSLKEFITVDIYGKCGTLSCPADHPDACFQMLKTTYYFYLSYENSNCVEYATEKLSTALENYVVPIYYGGIDLAKFLPPGSYIDARAMTSKELGSKLKHLMEHPMEYLEYFWWRDHYRIATRQQAAYKPFCKLCKMLHDTTLPPKRYERFNEWWNNVDGHPVCRKSYQEISANST